MKTNKIIAFIPLALISIFSANAGALETDCVYKAYSVGSILDMTKTWGTVTTWTPAEEAYYDKMEVSMNFLRSVPSMATAGGNVTCTIMNLYLR
ncbi:MAG: hypothetical protein WDZ76_07705 [Pseudohongiellaceae bacterium]